MDNTTKNRFTNVVIGGIMVIIFSLISFYAKSQDKIITKSGDTIKCTIQNNDGTNIIFKYKATDENNSSLNWNHIKDVIYAPAKITYSYRPSPLKHHYCEVICKYYPLETKVNINLGLKLDIYPIPKDFYTDKGALITFDNLMDAINFLDLHSYKPTNQFTVVVNGISEFHYIMYYTY